MYLPTKFMLLDALIRLGPTVLLIVQNMAPILQKFVTFDRHIEQAATPNLRNGSTFDFIIVGAGSSGSVLANRLSEHYRVLLLEAGGVPSPVVSVPIWSYLMNNQQPIDWQYRTVPQKHAAFGLNNNVSFWGSGKGLGGSSLINAAIFLRGNTQGFDTMANSAQDPRWRLDNMLRYYKGIEDYNGFFKDDGSSHGKGGELSIETAFTVPFIKNLMRAGQELGYKLRDPNGYGPITEGFAPMDFYLKFGRRHDAYTGSLLPVLGRSNLVLRKFSFVRQLLMNGTRTYGVEYERFNSVLTAYATKEVILCAGTFQNPKLLMLSGIGPKEHLQELGIPVVADLPVGKILEDKYGALVGPFVVEKGYSFDENRDITVSKLIQWLLTGKGTVATGRSEAHYQVISDYAKSEGRLFVPDLHTYVIAQSPGLVMDELAKSVLNANPQTVRYFNSAKGQDAFFQLVTMSAPFGHGNLRLANRNPYSHPIIDPNYLADPRDVKTLVDGVKFTVKLVEETSAFREIKGKLVGIPYPGCEHFAFKSDAYYECLARHITVSAFKYSGTTPMGKDRSDPNAVVDSKFRVLGVQGLRIVGGSMIRASIVSVNDVTCRMLGAFASDIIKEEYQGRETIPSFWATGQSAQKFYHRT